MTLNEAIGEANEAAPALLAALVGEGLLSEDSAARAERAHARASGSMVDVLIRLGLCAERDIAAVLSKITGCPLIGAKDFPEEPVRPELSNTQFLRDAKAVPVGEDESYVIVAAADPYSAYTAKALELAFGKPVAFAVATGSDIEDAIARLYARPDSAPGDFEATADVTASDFARLQEAASEAPIVRFVDRLIARAVELSASDIHIEPLERQLRVRIRVDGVLRDEEPAALSFAPAIVSRIKVLARLDIAERRLPQDGSIKMNVRGREIDLRVATAPVAHGESVVVRILDQTAVELDLAKLGFEPDVLMQLTALLSRPSGIFLVTGPTGSGKSTTLYAALSKLNSAARKIVTIEDPVELKLEGVNQIQVKPDIGLDFARTLRAVLRHDPDVIMVGEIRDAETARIAVQAALTGHLVLSSLHTNDAASAVTRLLEMGVEDYLVASTVTGVLAQRLVRVLCPACRVPVPTPTLGRMHIANAQCYEAKGCAQCGGTGYRGRSVIAELLPFDDAVRKATIEHADAARLRAIGMAAGMEPLYDNGVRKILSGISTQEEIFRVAQDVNR